MKSAKPTSGPPENRFLGLVLSATLGVVVGSVVLPVASVAAQESAEEAGPTLTISLPGHGDREGASAGIRMLLLLTVLSIAPGILISMTSFTRIAIVLQFARQAVGTQSAPPTQVLLALSLLLTGVVMAPVLERVHDEALQPYVDEEIAEEEAMELAGDAMRVFLLAQTRESDVLLFHELASVSLPTTGEDIPLRLLVPAFMLSELRTAFEMGFLLYLPFVLVDLLCASVLTAMGMVMMPPTMISTPLKILLFVMVDGWALLVRSLVASFG